MNLNKTGVFLGIILVCLAYILAISYNFSNFYFVLVSGMFVLVYSIYGLLKKPIDGKILLVTYFCFFLIGFISDSLGLLFRLWDYPSYVLIDYFILYLFVYPIAGLGMLYTFLIFEHLLFRNKIKSIKKSNSCISMIFFLFALLSVIAGIIFNNYINFFLCCAIILVGVGAMDLWSSKILKYSFLTEVYINLKNYLILFMLTAYLSGIIHEFPNFFSKEWVYSGFPLMNITIFHIPVIILFVGWIALIFGPLMVYKQIVYFYKQK